MSLNASFSMENKSLGASEKAYGNTEINWGILDCASHKITSFEVKKNYVLDLKVKLWGNWHWRLGTSFLNDWLLRESLLFSYAWGVSYYVKQIQLKLELAKWIMFTFNEQFSMLKTLMGCVEHIKGKCHMVFASRVIYIK